MRMRGHEPRPKRRTANTQGLRALGEAVDWADEPQERRAPGNAVRSRRSWLRRIGVAALAMVAIAGAVVGAGYAYLRYEFDRIQKDGCPSCVPVTRSAAKHAHSQPFNVLLIGSDSRVDESSQAFGSSSAVSGARSDTIKILHVDPNTGTARLLSIPRDTFVTRSGLPAGSGLDGAQKINAAFNNGPNGLVETIENTFGIPISHFVVIDFKGLVSAVQAVGGIELDFRYPVRDSGYNEATGTSGDLSGLDVASTGCQSVPGVEALELARSRHFEYLSDLKTWTPDPSSDIGRIERQNLIIDALVQKAESSHNPLTLRAFVSSAVNDIAVDDRMSLGLMLDLASRYHAFSTSSLATYTLPTSPASGTSAGDVETVDDGPAQQVIAQFLGSPPLPVTTPPLDASGEPQDPGPAPTATATRGTSGPSAPSGSAPASARVIPALFDPTPC